MWDLGGQTSIRPYWRCYYADTKAVVYVVDSSDRERLPINKAELLAMLNEEELQDAKLLVFANKQVKIKNYSNFSFFRTDQFSPFFVRIGSTGCDDRCRSFRRARVGHSQEQTVEYSQELCDQRRRSRRRSRLVRFKFLFMFTSFLNLPFVCSSAG